jgi:hypothetical protein
MAEQDRERVDTEDRQPDRHLSPLASRGGVGTREDREHHAVVGIGQQPPESGGCGGPGRLPGEDLLGVRVGPVLADERKDRGQVIGARGARHHTSSRTGS